MNLTCILFFLSQELLQQFLGGCQGCQEKGQGKWQPAGKSAEHCAGMGKGNGWDQQGTDGKA